MLRRRVTLMRYSRELSLILVRFQWSTELGGCVSWISPDGSSSYLYFVNSIRGGCFFIEGNSLKPRHHLHTVSLLSVIQDIPWDRNAVDGRPIIVVAVLLCKSSPLIRCPFPAHLWG